jgi:cell filamentation protein
MRAKGDKYDVSGYLEAQFQPGSRGKVLMNLRGITRLREMEALETAEHARLLREYVETMNSRKRFTAADIRAMHKNWLGKIYAWAGSYRNVNISKSGFPFAPASYIPQLMDDFERDILTRYTPCKGDIDTVSYGIAVTHAELILIHPFREGNGRLVRLFSVLMGLQAGFPPFDFYLITGKGQKAYFSAVRAALDRNYEPMKTIFRKIIVYSLRKAGKTQ